MSNFSVITSDIKNANLMCTKPAAKGKDIWYYERMTFHNHTWHATTTVRAIHLTSTIGINMYRSI